jgi:hypothetical protein
MGDITKTEESAGRYGSPNAMGLLVVAVGFVLSRLYFHWLGVRFETSSLEWYWQVLDPQLLTERLLESVFFLHAQPPLFNLFLGVGLKIAGAQSAVLFQLVFLALGLALAVVIYLMLARLGLSPTISAVLVLLYATSPNWLMYENWLFYDFPNAVALVLAAWALLQYSRRETTPWLALFFLLVGAVVWTRSLFHVAWFLGSVAIVLLAKPQRWRRVVVAAAVPLVLIGLLYGKNLMVFGFFGSSSWLGMSLTKMTTARLQPTERESWMRDGRLTPVAQVPPFSPVESYESVGVPVTDCGIPALGWRLRSTGAPNFNHIAYLDVSRASLSDAVTVIRERPGVYLRSVGAACARFFWSPVNYPPFRDNLVATASTYRLFESTVNLPPVAAMLGLLAFSYGGLRVWRWARGRGSKTDLFFAWSVFTISWVFCVGNLLEFGENFRFRFAVEPLVVVLLGAVLGEVAKRKTFNV